LASLNFIPYFIFVVELLKVALIKREYVTWDATLSVLNIGDSCNKYIQYTPKCHMYTKSRISYKIVFFV